MKLAYVRTEALASEVYHDLAWIAESAESLHANSVHNKKNKANETPARFGRIQVSTASHLAPTLSRESAINFDELSQNVIQARRENGTRVLALTSATSGEGSSTIAYFLALKLVQAAIIRKAGVLLIDANPFRPQQHHFFGIPQQAGLVKISLGTDSLARQDSLYLLTSRISPAQWGKFIKAGTYESLINKLRKKFEFIILDAPAILPHPDSARLCRISDGALLVVNNNEPERDEIAAASRRLSQHNVKTLGIVFNNVSNSNSNKNIN